MTTDGAQTPPPYLGRGTARERVRSEKAPAGSPSQAYLERARKIIIHDLRYVLIILPSLCLGLLTLDIPLRFFDTWAATPSLIPSQWLARGDLFLAIAVFKAVLITRRAGMEIGIRTLMAAWAASAALAGLVLVSIFSKLEPGDLPSVRWTIGVLLSWVSAGYIAVVIYDLTRGRSSWVPPFAGLMSGFAVQGVILFPGLYHGSGTPWVSWFVADLIVDGALALFFLVIYRFLQKRIRPKPGLGGA